MSDKEDIYDQEIAPLLREAGEIAVKNCIDIVCAVDLNDEEDPLALGLTKSVDITKAQAAMRLVYFAAESLGNVDKFITLIRRDQRGRPHNSMYLKIWEDQEKNDEVV